MGRTVGIDLGTTYSAVAVVGDGGTPRALVNRDGERIMPSVVMFLDGTENVLVGEMAKRSMAAAPDDVVQLVKRYMGNPAWRFDRDDGRQFTAEEISAIILRRLKEDAESHLGEGEVTRAVITVPAYFDDAKRRATIDAGRIAGLEVARVLNEPTAAALAFGLGSGRDGTYLVYDLGGGTFDVTLLRIEGGAFEVIGTDGLHELGGFEWDNRLMELVNERFQRDGGPDLLEDFATELALRERVELAKHTLSQSDSARVVISVGGHSAVIGVTRADFEVATARHLNESRDLMQSVVEEAGVTWSEISGVLLAGGSTRMAMVREMVEAVSGRPPIMEGNPDELVALGAAIQAGLEEGSDTAPTASGETITVQDVTSHGLGVIALDDDLQHRNFVVLPRNTKIPDQGFRDFNTVEDGQSEIRVKVTQGDDEDPDWVRHVGEQTLTVPPYPAGSPIRVIFSYDVDQTVHISVTDLRTEKSLGAFEAHNVANLTDEELVAACEKNRNLEVQ